MSVYDYTYSCLTCGNNFSLDPNRDYMVYPLHCPDCETKMADAIRARFDADMAEYFTA